MVWCGVLWSGLAWSVWSGHTNGHTVEDSAVFCWGWIRNFSFSKLKSTKVHRHEKSTPPPVRFLPFPLNFAWISIFCLEMTWFQTLWRRRQILGAENIIWAVHQERYLKITFILTVHLSNIMWNDFCCWSYVASSGQMQGKIFLLCLTFYWLFREEVVLLNRKLDEKMLEVQV